MTLLELISRNLETVDLPKKKIKSGLEKLKQLIGKHDQDKTSTETTIAEGSTAAKTNNEQSSTTTSNNSWSTSTP